MRTLCSLIVLLVYLPQMAAAHPCLQGFAASEGRAVASWRVNSSSPFKRQRLSRVLSGVTFSREDLAEIDSNHLEVVAHKASQFDRPDERVIVEDTALHVEGADVGIHVKWFADRLGDYVGRRATWVSLLAYRDGNKIVIFRGEVSGVIVAKKQGVSGGIEPHFRPDGSQKTALELGEAFESPAMIAAANLIAGRVYALHQPVDTWNGPWQQ